MGALPPVSGDPPAKKDGKSTATSSDRYGEVIALYKKGMSGSDIARQSGLPEGEISLILDLERAKGDSLAKDQKIAKP
jgi:DNA-binding NarL/FixJ family response regulator